MGPRIALENKSQGDIVTAEEAAPEDQARSRHGAAETTAGILTLVQVDDAARMRGIDVDGEALRKLPNRVLLTQEVIVLFEP